MVEKCRVRYDAYGDGTKTPPNAPHCLLLWRKPPPILSAEALFNPKLFLARVDGYIGDGQNDKEGTTLPHCRLDPDASLMGIHDGLDDCQPKP